MFNSFGCGRGEVGRRGAIAKEKFKFIGGMTQQEKDQYMMWLVAEWACAQMEAFEKGDMTSLASGLSFQLHEITKQYPHLLEGKDGEKYLRFLKDFQIPQKDS